MHRTQILNKHKSISTNVWILNNIMQRHPIQIKSLVVSKEWRRKGIGSMLLSSTIREEPDAPYIFLFVDTRFEKSIKVPLQSFYSSFGFKAISLKKTQILMMR